MMSIRSIGEHRRRIEEPREALQSWDQPIGVFRARSTRDANALERDGQNVFAMNDVPGSTAGAAIIEVLFEDGYWMLCDVEELNDV
jgi:hypothetical protein